MLRARMRCAVCERWVDVLGLCSECEPHVPTNCAKAHMVESSIRDGRQGQNSSVESSILRKESSLEITPNISCRYRDSGRKVDERTQSRSPVFAVCTRQQRGRNLSQFLHQQVRASSCPASPHRKIPDGSKPPNAHKFRDESPKKLQTKIRCTSCGCWAARGNHCYYCKAPTPYYPPSSAAAGDAFQRLPSGFTGVGNSSNLRDWSSISDVPCSPIQLQESNVAECPPSWDMRCSDRLASAVPQTDPTSRQSFVSPIRGALLSPARRQHSQRVSFSDFDVNSLGPSSMAVGSCWSGFCCNMGDGAEQKRFDREAFCDEWEKRLLQSWFDFQLASSRSQPCHIQNIRPRTFVEALHETTSESSGGRCIRASCCEGRHACLGSSLAFRQAQTY